MRELRRHKLPTLSLGIKTKFSLLLFLGTCLILATRFAVPKILEFIHFLYDRSASWGTLLGFLAWDRTDLYLLFFGAHLIGLAACIFAFDRIAQLSDLTRRMRRTVLMFTNAIVAIDVLAWLAVTTFVSCRLASTFISASTAVALATLYLFPLRRIWIYKKWRRPPHEPVRVVVVGSGVGGLRVAQRLDANLGHHSALEVTMVSREAHVTLQPLLPCVAAGSIQAETARLSLRKVIQNSNIDVLRYNVLSIDAKNNRVMVERRCTGIDAQDSHGVLHYIPYDILVLATGSGRPETSIQGAGRYGFYLKSVEDALRLRSHIYDCLERASAEDDDALRRELLCFAVVGAGATGVEMAIQISRLVCECCSQHYPHIHASEIQVWLLEEDHEILPQCSLKILRAAAQQLKKENVNILLGAKVSEIGPDSVSLADGRRHQARTCVVCTGFRATPLLRTVGGDLDHLGRLTVDIDLRAPGFQNIFCIGDAAHSVDGRTGRPLSADATVAVKQAEATAKNIERILNGHGTRAFSFSRPRFILSLGLGKAVTERFYFRIGGRWGGVLWLKRVLSYVIGSEERAKLALAYFEAFVMSQGIVPIDVHSSSQRRSKSDAA